MPAAKNQPAMTTKDTKRYTWRIEGFSKRTETTLCSDPFLAGGHKWAISVCLSGRRTVDATLFVYLKLVEMRHGDGMLAHYSVTVVNQLSATSSVKLGGNRSFDKKNGSWGLRTLVGVTGLKNPPKGFLVNDTLIIEAEVSVEEAAASESEAAAACDDEPKVIEADDQPHEAIKVSVAQPLSQHEINEVPSAAKQSGATSSSPLSGSDVQLNSRNLIEELSSMITSSCDGSSSCSPPPNPDHHGSDLLQQQWEKLDEFLGMSLEAISQSKSLDEVESIATKLSEHATDPIQKTVLKDVVSRLAEFKDTIPSSLSTIESSNAVESSVAQMKKDMEVRLVHRKRQLSSLEAEVSRIGEEDAKLESEMQQLSARKAKIVDHRNSTLVELEKANQEASKELGELKKQCGEGKQAVEKRMRAMERLARSNASWKLFKANLRR